MRTLVLALLVLIAAAPAAAQNLVVNSDFAADVSSWAATVGGTFTHDPALDVNGNPASGSGSAVNPLPFAFGSFDARQCIEGIAAGASYDFGGAIYFDSTIQSATGRANVVVNFWDGASCLGSIVGADTTTDVLATTTDTWVPVEVVGVVAPAGSQSVSVKLFVNKFDEAGQIEANFDDVFFRPTPPPEVPTLSPLALTLLTCAVAGASLWRCRFRKPA
ncbi:MAG: IPTL-CTERM sorting domain-containing protein [Deltaproteobacteria bacterium]|jgi:hypothetical protein|nr:IPTL-CTERM sorting domain-containing protein [Deltaproteobacteria bacterium]